MQAPPLFCVACIDYRFDALTATFFKSAGREMDFFLSTAAGGPLALGCASSRLSHPSPDVLQLFQKSLVTNLDIALTLQPIKDIYLMNHQDCGAMKHFLACSGYPKSLGENNQREIQVHGEVLALAHQFMAPLYPYKRIKLGLIDINGAVAEYDINSNTWTVVHTGETDSELGLWYGLNVGDVYPFESGIRALARAKAKAPAKANPRTRAKAKSFRP